MNKKAKRIILLLSFIMTISIIGNISILYKKDTPPKETNRTVAMYIENDNGEYDLSSQTSFPTDGYILNTEKSSCRNGGTISQDLKTKKLSVSVTNKDECTLYFDKVTPIDIIKEKF